MPDLYLRQDWDPDLRTSHIDRNPCAPGFEEKNVLSAAASLERYSKHPLAQAILNAADRAHVPRRPCIRNQRAARAGSSRHRPGENDSAYGPRTGSGSTRSHSLHFTPDSNAWFLSTERSRRPFAFVMLLDTIAESSSSISGRSTKSTGCLLVSGDRESEVRYLAGAVGISEIYAGQSPEQKVAIVREETNRAKTVFVGDGINDAPAMQAATVGIAFGLNSDVAAEAADAVILESSLGKVDELIHIGRRMRSIALQSAVGGMALSALGHAGCRLRIFAGDRWRHRPGTH